ncbi:unnamed protein product [Sympodiomycopsis kandeliae]
MRSIFSLVAIVSLLSSTAWAGAGEICIQKDNNCIDYQSTKDCCAASAGKTTHFREDFHICANDNLFTDNSLNTGAMVACCEGRGMGSKEVSSAGDADRPPKCSNKRSISIDRERDHDAGQLVKRKGCAMTTSLGSPPTAGFGVGICQAGGGKCVLSEDGSKCELNEFAKAHCPSVGCNGPL